MVNQRKDISLVIPVKDEEANVEFLALEIEKVFEDSSREWECIWVDDGSTDATRNKLRAICQAESHHRFISLEENAGQSAALFAGFRESLGNVIATIDGDGQNDPADIPALAEAVLSGECDMANGYRANRKDSLWKKFCSRIGNGVRNYVTGIKIRDVGCSTRAFRRECVIFFPAFKGMHRFIPTIAGIQGFVLREYPVNHRPRRAGTSKYTALNRAFVGFLDCLGIRWLKNRNFRYRVSKISGNDQRCEND